MSKLKLDQDERDYYENLSELYSILVSTEHLEKHYLKGTAVTTDQYNLICSQLLSQYKTWGSLNKKIDVKQFISEYSLDLPAAYNRLVEIGVPATVEHSLYSVGNNRKVIAETVQFFITLMDSLKLGVVCIDEVFPQLSDLMQTINKADAKGVLLESKQKMKDWLIVLNQKKASDELDSAEVRQLLFDLESAYADFQNSLL